MSAPSFYLCCYIVVLLLLIICWNCYELLCLLYVRLTVPHSCLRHEVRLPRTLTANPIGDASLRYFHLVHSSEWLFLLPASPGNCDPVGSVQEAGWAPGPVWTCAKKLAPTGIRSPDRPARGQSLYRLSYTAHLDSDSESLLLFIKYNWYNSSTVETLSITHICWKQVQLT
jgi:hypothetical protein